MHWSFIRKTYLLKVKYIKMLEFHTNTLRYIQQVCWRTQSETQQIDGMQSEHISFQSRIQSKTNRAQTSSESCYTDLSHLQQYMVNSWTRLQISGALGRKDSVGSRFKLQLMTPGKSSFVSKATLQFCKNVSK